VTNRDGRSQDTAAIRALLDGDRPWAVYALGDLDPRRARFCDWYVQGESIALLYREFATPILFALGASAVLDAVPPVDACLLQVPESFLPALQRCFRLDRLRMMHRMVLAPEAFAQPAGDPGVEALDESHEQDLLELYADGHDSEEEPDFFMRSQLQDATFFGVRREGRLVAAGGTHLYSEQESVAAIGNVYTHRAHRGRRHASAVTAAIVRRLLERGTRTIGLNVRRGNDAAVHVYQRLGFRHHSDFWEGLAIHP